MTTPLTTTVDQPGASLAASDAADVNPVGAPANNVNAMRHGLRASKLPKGCERIGRDVNDFRRALEDAVFDLHGEVNATHALLISSACQWETHRRLALRWLRVNFDDLSHTDRLNYSRDAAKAASERNKVIDALKLDEQTKAGCFYGLPELTFEQPRSAVAGSVNGLAGVGEVDGGSRVLPSPAAVGLDTETSGRDAAI